MRRSISAAVVLALALAAGPAAAQDDDLLPVEHALTAGAGGVGFTDSDTADVIDIGATWEVRLRLGANMPVGLEAAYVGAAHDLDAPDATLLANGLEASVRVDLGTFSTQPFFVVGLGWMHYSLLDVDDADAFGLLDDDDVMTVPIAAGLSWRTGRALIDVRATFRYAIDDELIQGDPDFAREDTLDSFSATANVGFVF